MSKLAASFDAVDFESTVPGLKLIATDPYRPANRTVVTNPLARTNKSVTSSAWFKDKKLNVTAEIGQNTRELMDDAIDILKGIIQGREKTLQLNYGTGTGRQWTATYDNLTISDVQGGHCTVVIEWEAAYPYGFDIASTTLVTGAQTGASRTDHFVLGGSADKQLPVITITLTTVTPGSNHGITLTNPATGQAIVINQLTWANGDVLVFDPSSTTPVTVNGTAVAFTGPIIEWDKGAGSLQYGDTFTSRKFSIGVTHRKRWA